MSRTLALHEIAPTIDLVGYWAFPRRFDGAYRVPGHHLMLIERGEIRATTPFGRFTANAHDLICFRPADRNAYATHGDTAFYQLHCCLAPPPLHRLTLWLDELGPLPMRVALGAHFPRARALFEAVCMALPRPGAAARLRAHAALVELLALAAESASGSRGGDLRLDRLQRARLRLESGLQGDLGIAEVARETGLGVDAFIRAFRQRFGTTPKQHRTRAKLRWAAQRLQAGAAPVKQVMVDLGFRDATAFARLFRRYLGLLPSQVLAQSGALVPPVAAPAEDRQGLFPRDRHLTPPDAAADWQRQFDLR